MSSVENKKLIQDAFTAWANGDGMAFFNLLADNATWTVIGNCPISGTYVGRQQLVEEALSPQREKLAGPPTPTVINIISNRKTRLQGILVRLAPDGLSPLLLQFLEAAPRPVAEAIKRLDPTLYL